jgi:hypothetical protein
MVHLEVTRPTTMSGCTGSVCSRAGACYNGRSRRDDLSRAWIAMEAVSIAAPDAHQRLDRGCISGTTRHIGKRIYSAAASVRWRAAMKARSTALMRV